MRCCSNHVGGEPEAERDRRASRRRRPGAARRASSSTAGREVVVRREQVLAVQREPTQRPAGGRAGARCRSRCPPCGRAPRGELAAEREPAPPRRASRPPSRSAASRRRAGRRTQCDAASSCALQVGGHAVADDREEPHRSAGIVDGVGDPDAGVGAVRCGVEQRRHVDQRQRGRRRIRAAFTAMQRSAVLVPCIVPYRHPPCIAG